MELFWYIVLMAMLTVYVILDGYDFGVGIVHLFFAKEEKEKVDLIKSIGPFWDANEVWLIAAGGVLFFSFPLLYAVSFSGFYLPLIMILWLLIFRGISIELRGFFDHQMWTGVWDKAFGISSLLLALFFGLALGNIIRGVNLGGVIDGVASYEGFYYFVPLWDSSFSPTAESPGIIDWFTLIIGVIGVFSLMIHGMNWVVYKTNSTVKERIMKRMPLMTAILAIVLIIALGAWFYLNKAPMENFIDKPVLFIFPIITMIGLAGMFRANKFVNELKGFLFSSLYLIGAMGSVVSAIFPKLLPSTNSIVPSLTISNAKAPDYALNVGFGWWLIAITLVMIYFIIQYYLFRGKTDDINYHDDH